MFSQQLEKADDSLHYRVNTIAGFKMNLDNSHATLQRVRFEQGCPNASIGEWENRFFCGLMRVLAERWRRHYNAVRPHSSLGDRPPAPEAWMTNNKGHGEMETATRLPFSTPPTAAI